MVKQKKFMCTLMITFLLVSINVIPSFGSVGLPSGKKEHTPRNITVTMDNRSVPFTNDTGYPLIDENGRTLVPLRITMESFGCIVDWKKESQTAIIRKEKFPNVIVKVGDKFISCDGNKVENDSSAKIIGDRVYLPARVVLESFRATVDWNESRKSIVVSSPNIKKENTRCVDTVEDICGVYVFLNDGAVESEMDEKKKSDENYDSDNDYFSEKDKENADFYYPEGKIDVCGYGYYSEDMLLKATNSESAKNVLQKYINNDKTKKVTYKNKKYVYKDGMHSLKGFDYKIIYSQKFQFDSINSIIYFQYSDVVENCNQIKSDI